MSATDERTHELLGLYVLGAVTPAEFAEFQAHPATCAGCRREVAALGPVAAGLARAVPQVSPPASLRERVIRAATGVTPTSGGEAASDIPARTPVLPWLLAAASLVTVVALGAYGIEL